MPKTLSMASPGFQFYPQSTLSYNIEEHTFFGAERLILCELKKWQRCFLNFNFLSQILFGAIAVLPIFVQADQTREFESTFRSLEGTRSSLNQKDCKSRTLGTCSPIVQQLLQSDRDDQWFGALDEKFSVCKKYQSDLFLKVNHTDSYLLADYYKTEMGFRQDANVEKMGEFCASGGETSAEKALRVSKYYDSLGRLQNGLIGSLKGIAMLSSLLGDKNVDKKTNCTQSSFNNVRVACADFTNNCKVPYTISHLAKMTDAIEGEVRSLKSDMATFEKLYKSPKVKTDEERKALLTVIEAKRQMIDRKYESIPWVRRSNWNQNPRVSTGTKIKIQLKNDLKALENSYRQMDKAASCIIAGDETCGFKNTREALYIAPTLSVGVQPKMEISKTASGLLDFQSCLLNAKENQDQYRETVEPLFFEIPLLLVSGSGLPRLGAQLFLGVQRGQMSARAAQISGQVALSSSFLGDSYAMAINVADVYRECSGVHQRKVENKFKQNASEACGQNLVLSHKEEEDAISSCVLATVFSSSDVFRILNNLSSTAFSGVQKLKNEIAEIERAKRIKPDFSDSRSFQVATLDHLKEAGRKVKSRVIKNIPKSMEVGLFRNKLNDEYYAFEKVVKRSDGTFGKIRMELPFDKKTGTIDANLSGGDQFYKSLIEESGGKVALVVIDFDNLRYVSKNFHGGQKLPALEAQRFAREKGDQYLKDGVEAIKEVVGDKGVVFRTGGDEFHIVLHETDPQKVKEINDQISKAIRKKARGVFTEETKARAEQVRRRIAENPEKRAEIEAEFRLEYAPYSQPNVSIGSTIVNQDPIEDAIEKAEKQLERHKLETKRLFNADRRKYTNGGPADPNRRPLLGRIVETEVPAIGRMEGSASGAAPIPIESVKEYIQEVRVGEVFRVKDLSVVRYEDEFGGVSYKAEQYFGPEKGARFHVMRDLLVNKKINMVDSRGAEAQSLIHTFVNSDRTRERGIIWLNAENLKIVNYFDGKSKAGDKLLAEIGKSISQAIGKENIPVKIPGSEFLVLTEHLDVRKMRATLSNADPSLSDRSIEKLMNESVQDQVQKIRKAVYNNPEIKKIFEDELSKVKQALEDTRARVVSGARSEDLNSIRELSLRAKLIEEARENLISVHGTGLRDGDTMESAMSRTRAIRYPGEPFYGLD